MDYDGTQTSSYFDVSVISAVCDTNIENDVLQTEADAVLDFTETNPFGMP